MFTDLFSFLHFYYEAANDKGADGASEQENAIAENNRDITEITQGIAQKTEKKADPKSRHIGYFEQDLGIETDEEDESGEEEESEKGLEDEKKEKDSKKYRQEISEEDEEDEGEEDEGDEEDEGEEDEDEIDPAKKDYFYVPNRDAKDRDVYPNEYPTKMDAQFALSQKVNTYDKYVDALKDNESDIGGAIDPSDKELIEKYRDVNYASTVPDDQMKSDLATIDEALKAVKLKTDRVTREHQQSQQNSKIEQKWKSEQKKAFKSKEELGITDQELDSLNNDKDEFLSLVDQKIQDQLQDIDKQIEDHKNDEDYLDEHGLAEYNAKRDRLAEQRNQKFSELQQHRQNFSDYWDVGVEYEKAQKQTKTTMSDADRMIVIDNAFSAFAEDRKEGPRALDIFKASDTAPMNHFKSYALAPSNINKYDLTTIDGWNHMYKDWKGWVNDNLKSSKVKTTTNRNKKSGKKTKHTSSKTSKIPRPSTLNNTSYLPNNGDIDGLASVNKEINQLSHSIMKDNR